MSNSTRKNTRTRNRGMDEKLVAYTIALTEGSKKPMFDFNEQKIKLFNNKYYFFYKEKKTMDEFAEDNDEEKIIIYYGNFKTPKNEDSITLIRNIFPEENQVVPDDDGKWIGSKMTELLKYEKNNLINSNKEDVIFNEENNIYLYRFMVLNKFFKKEEIQLKKEIILLTKAISMHLRVDITTWIFHEPDPNIYLYNILEKNQKLLNMYVESSNKNIPNIIIKNNIKNPTQARSIITKVNNINATLNNIKDSFNAELYSDAKELSTELKKTETDPLYAKVDEYLKKSEARKEQDDLIKEKFKSITSRVKQIREEVEAVRQKMEGSNIKLPQISNKGGKRKTRRKQRKH